MPITSARRGLDKRRREVFKNKNVVEQYMDIANALVVRAFSEDKGSSREGVLKMQEEANSIFAEKGYIFSHQSFDIPRQRAAVMGVGWYAYGKKTFMLSENLCWCLNNSDIGKIPAHLVKLPYPVVKFVLPPNVLTSIKEDFSDTNKVTAIWAGRINPKYPENIETIATGPGENPFFSNLHIDLSEHETVNSMVEWTMSNAEHISKRTSTKAIDEFFSFVIKVLLYLNSDQAKITHGKNVSKMEAKIKATRSRDKRESLTEMLAKAKNIYYVGQGIKINKDTPVSNDGITSGKKYTLSKRFTVRGHLRTQPCGPGRKDVKIIYIAPYWKGPDVAEVIHKQYNVYCNGPSK